MITLNDSIAIESNKKRIPVTRSGKLLVAVRDKIIDDIKLSVKDLKFYITDYRIEVVLKLNRRINGRLLREDIKIKEQNQLKLYNYGKNKTRN